MKNKHPIRWTLAALQVAMLLIIAAGVGTLTGCPKTQKDAVRAAVEASYRLPAATNDLIAKVTEARDTGIISVEQARNLGEKINVLAKAEVKFVQMVKVAEAASRALGAIDEAKKGEIRDYFDTSVISPFLDILSATNLLSGTNAALVTAGVSGVRILLKTIAGGIGSKRTNTVSVGIIQTGRETAAIVGYRSHAAYA